MARKHRGVGDGLREVALPSSVDCRPDSALKIFVYMSRMNNNKKLLCFLQTRTTVLKRNDCCTNINSLVLRSSHGASEHNDQGMRNRRKKFGPIRKARPDRSHHQVNRCGSYPTGGDTQAFLRRDPFDIGDEADWRKHHFETDVSGRSIW